MVAFHEQCEFCFRVRTSILDMKLLLIEDNPDDVRLFQEFLKDAGAQHITIKLAGSIHEARDKMTQDSFDLVLADLSLPDGQGLDCFRQIHATNKSLPIVVLTGLDDKELAMQAVREGAQDYLIKGEVDENLLLRAATYAIERQRTQTELEQLFDQVKKSRDDLLSILNELHIGTILLRQDGEISFVSVMAEHLLSKPAQQLIDQPWDKACGFDISDIHAIQKQFNQSPTERTKITLSMTGPHDKKKWLDVDVKNDPRESGGNMLFLYDVTEVQNLRRLVDEKSKFHDLIGKSSSMQEVYKRIQTLADVDTSVLIEGETGTGKELVARALHYSSPRREKPFVAINCAGLTESLLSSQLFGHKRGSFTGATTDHRGFFETAEKGTIFLDEIGDMPLNIQSALLRVLQEKEVTRVGESQPRKVDVRIITATHQHLAEQVTKGKFRADLLYRIRVGRISLPSLRDRREDLPLLVSSFLSHCRTSMGKFSVQDISQEALSFLSRYDWPGNVRELKSVIEFAVLQCPGSVINSNDLPPEILEVPNRTSLTENVSSPTEPAEKTKEKIVEALKQTKGNRTAAARLMGISRATFYRWLEELDISSST